jgi:hypothetical protein
MKVACAILLGIAIVNFLAFIIVAAFLGGDAVNGMMKDGHYYLAQHGRYTEVPRAVFDYSRHHVYSLIVTHPAGMAAAWYLGRITSPGKQSPP